ncbi:hypothetical protein INS49_009243 [Diaporthe citri]|uniref:uncharacterized protein n=1 Tax=Diaporthe citri TaxID=83186 RepID=UPI001C8165C3|nr:uncharacterized protein INS49_009243 [Diaporthe citri]KAG6361024.1 hypothetical protein INS49_009243 [Diaporthe citri]
MPNGQTCVQTASNVFLTAHCGAEGSFLSTGFATFPLVSTITSGEGLLTSSAHDFKRLYLSRYSSGIIFYDFQHNPEFNPRQFYLGRGIIWCRHRWGVFLFIKRRKTRGNISDDVMKAAVSDRKQGGHEGVSELPSVERSLELPGLRDPSELSGYQSPVELPASPYTPHAVRYRP